MAAGQRWTNTDAQQTQWRSFFQGANDWIKGAARTGEVIGINKLQR